MTSVRDKFYLLVCMNNKFSCYSYKPVKLVKAKLARLLRA